MSAFINVLIVDGGRKTIETEAAGIDMGAGQPAVASNVEFAAIAGGRRIAQLNVDRDDFARAVAQGELWAYSKGLNRPLQGERHEIRCSR